MYYVELSRYLDVLMCETIYDVRISIRIHNFFIRFGYEIEKKIILTHK